MGWGLGVGVGGGGGVGGVVGIDFHYVHCTFYIHKETKDYINHI